MKDHKKGLSLWLSLWKHVCFGRTSKAGSFLSSTPSGFASEVSDHAYSHLAYCWVHAKVLYALLCSAHPFTFFLLDTVRFLFMGISFLLLGATEESKLRNLCDAKFCHLRRIQKIAFFRTCSLTLLSICLCSSGFCYERF